MARTPATYEDRPSGEMARTSVICEDRLISEDFSESSYCNSVVNKSVISHLISNQYLEHFTENEPKIQHLKNTLVLVYSGLFKNR